MKKRTGKANNSKRLIIPTIFAHNKKEFDLRFEEINKLGKNLQVDFMDGKFVKGKSIRIGNIPNLLKFNKNFEAHLMIENPEKKFKKIKKKGFKKVIFHYEATKEKTYEVIWRARKFGFKVFLAINPSTKSKEIFEYLAKVDGVLLMGVHPGKEHQKFIEKVYIKIKEIKKESPKTIVQIDGGVNLITAKKLKKAGADILNTGSFVASAKSPKKALKELKDVFV